jgi:hypothetical protein
VRRQERTRNSLGGQRRDIVPQAVKPVLPENRAGRLIEAEELSLGVRIDPTVFDQQAYEPLAARDPTLALRLPRGSAGIFVNGHYLRLHAHIEMI